MRTRGNARAGSRVRCELGSALVLVLVIGVMGVMGTVRLEGGEERLPRRRCRHD